MKVIDVINKQSEQILESQINNIIETILQESNNIEGCGSAVTTGAELETLLTAYNSKSLQAHVENTLTAAAAKKNGGKASTIPGSVVDKTVEQCRSGILNRLVTELAKKVSNLNPKWNEIDLKAFLKSKISKESTISIILNRFKENHPDVYPKGVLA